MKINIKIGGAAFALHLGPTDFRSIIIVVVLAFHPASQPVLEGLQRVVMQGVTWSSHLAVAEIYEARTS